MTDARLWRPDPVVDAVARVDPDRLRTLLQRGHNPNQSVDLHIEEIDSSLSFHTLSYLLLQKFSEDPLAAANIKSSIEALLKPRREDGTSAIEYLHDSRGLCPADYAAICPDAETGAAVIMDRITQDGMRYGGTKNVFTPFYDRLFVFEMMRAGGRFSEGSALNVARKVYEYLEDIKASLNDEEKMIDWLDEVTKTHGSLDAARYAMSYARLGAHVAEASSVWMNMSQQISSVGQGNPHMEEIADFSTKPIYDAHIFETCLQRFTPRKLQFAN